MPRRLLVALVVSLVVLALFAVRLVFFPPTNQHITWEDLTRIEPGMREDDVEAILRPPGDYRTGPTVNRRYSRSSGTRIHLQLPPAGDKGLNWLSDEGEIEVWFDASGAVCFVTFDETEPDPKGLGLAEWLRWRCDRWQWHRRGEYRLR